MASLASETTRTGVSVEMVHGTEDLMGMREEWSDLLTESATDCVFLTWEWLTTWWRHLAGERKLFVLAVRQRGLLLAIAPLVVRPDRKSTRLNSSHSQISYAVFCLKKKKIK